MATSIQITETSPLLHDANCVYCHVRLELGDRAAICERCTSPHHIDCWEANGSNCAIFGCGGAGSFAVQNPLERVPVGQGQQSSGAIQTQPSTLTESTMAETIVNRVIWPLGSAVVGVTVFVAAQSAIFAIGRLLFDALSLPNAVGIMIVLGGVIFAFGLGIKAKNFVLGIRDRRYLQS